MFWYAQIQTRERQCHVVVTQFLAGSADKPHERVFKRHFIAMCQVQTNQSSSSQFIVLSKCVRRVKRQQSADATSTKEIFMLDQFGICLREHVNSTALRKCSR